MHTHNPPGRKRAARLSSTGVAMTGPGLALVEAELGIACNIRVRAPQTCSGGLALQDFVDGREQVPRGEGLAEHAEDAAWLGVARLEMIAARRQHDRGDVAGA